MTKQKMSREELNKESLRLSALIAEGSKAELQGVKELSKQQFSLEQMSNAVERHHREAAQMWKQGRTPVSAEKSE